MRDLDTITNKVAVACRSCGQVIGEARMVVYVGDPPGVTNAPLQITVLREDVEQFQEMHTPELCAEEVACQRNRAAREAMSRKIRRFQMGIRD